MRRRTYSSSSSSSEDIPLIAIKTNNYRYEVIRERLLREASQEQCEVCLKLFNNKYAYLVHNASHIIIPLLKLEFLQCTNCLKYFTTQEDLEDHKKENHPIVNVTNDNNIEYNSADKNNDADHNNIIKSNVKENEVKRSYISVRKNLFNVTQDDTSNVCLFDKEEMDILKIDKILGEKVEFLKNRCESLVKAERLNGTENSDSIRNRIVFEDDAQALPSSILNEIVNECKDAMDLIEPSWLVNSLTNDSFDDDDNQNGDAEAFRSQDGVNNLNIKDLCMQIAADSELKRDAQSISQNGVADLQNGVGVIHHGAGILQNSAEILQNSAGILQNSAGILQNSAEILQNGILQNGPNIFLDGIRILQNGAGVLQNWPSLLDGSTVIESAGGIIQTNAGILQNEPNILLDGASIVHNSNLIQYGAGNLGTVINNTQIGGMAGNCIECLNNGIECRLHGIGSQNHVKKQQNNIIKQQYPVKDNHNIQNGGDLFQPHNALNQPFSLQGQQHSLQGQQHSLQGQQHSLQGQQHSLQGQQHSLQGQQYGLQGQQNDLIGQKNPQLCKLLEKKLNHSFHTWTSTKPIDYKKLIKPGVYKCKRCCKIYPNRLKLLKHEPTHIVFDRWKPDPCYYCERYVLKEAMDRHCSKFHHECIPVTNMTPSKCRICGLNAFNWSLHYNLYHNAVVDKVEKEKQETTMSLLLCELCFKDMKSNSLEIKAVNFTHGLCKRCKKQPVSKRVYGWTKKPLAERLKVIRKRLNNIRQMNKY